MMNPFDKFNDDCQQFGVAHALQNLGQYLAGQKRWDDLFEVRKLQLRHRLGLPIEKWQAIDEMPAEKSQQLEQGLLEICREIGTCLMEEGRVDAGWRYLQPVGDRPLVGQLLRQIQVTDDNVESIIEVSIDQGVEPEIGFGLVLDRYGTCSSITTYESRIAMQPLAIRRRAAVMLVEHLYRELCARVIESIHAAKSDSTINIEDDRNLLGLIQGRDWLFQNMGHHIDTTHLASVVRIARVIDRPRILNMAIELADYGSRLHDDFQYPGRVPFEDTYADSRSFFRALVGQDPDREINRLQDLLCSQSSHSLDAVCWLVYLYDQLGLGKQAITAYLDYVHNARAEMMPVDDVCPNLLYLVSRYQQFDLVKSRLTQMGDLLNYATVCSVERQATVDDGNV